jgi:tRNA A58 N-methylase Trm61
MDYSGIEKLYKYVNELNKDISTFIDVGSGRGKLCLFMASIPKIKKSIGIELVVERYEDALALKSELSPEYADKVEFLNSNIFDVSLPSSTQTFVWFSNLCFDSATTDNIFQKFTDELPPGSIVCCSQTPKSNNPKLQFIKQVPIEMSWSKNSQVHIYKIIA